jgi:hypothetical protein
VDGSLDLISCIILFLIFSCTVAGVGVCVCGFIPYKTPSYYKIYGDEKGDYKIEGKALCWFTVYVVVF